jgi:hypothetical protein
MIARRPARRKRRRAKDFHDPYQSVQLGLVEPLAGVSVDETRG